MKAREEAIKIFSNCKNNLIYFYGKIELIDISELNFKSKQLAVSQIDLNIQSLMLMINGTHGDKTIIDKVNFQQEVLTEIKNF